MSLRRRVKVLQRWQRTLPLYVEPPSYTREELSKMGPHELVKLYFDEIRWSAPLSPEDRAEIERHREELRRLPKEELARRYREALGGA